MSRESETSNTRATESFSRGLARGAWPVHSAKRQPWQSTTDCFLILLQTPANTHRLKLLLEVRTGVQRIARGYVDDRAKPERLRFPRLPRKEGRGKRGNARLRPHTHRQPQQQETIHIFDLKKGESGAGACAFAVEVPSCGKVCGAGAGPDQKAGPVFFAVSKKSSGPAAQRGEIMGRAFDRTAAATPVVSRRVGTEGWAFSDRTKGLCLDRALTRQI